MALFLECTPEFAQKCLTPLTLLERRFYANNLLSYRTSPTFIDLPLHPA
jgi:hypothetical protein